MARGAAGTPAPPTRRPRRHVSAQAKSKVDSRRRSWLALTAILALLVAAIVRLVMIQTVDASAYATRAADQRTRTITLPASRGTIYGRNGTPLAFTVQGRALAAWPALFTSDTERHAVADIIGKALAPTVTAADVFRKLTDGTSTYVYLARGLLPAQADAIMAQIAKVIDPTTRNPVTTERQDLRQYPEGTALASLLGHTGWDGHGTGGIEIQYDSLLSGKDGSRVVDVDGYGNPMPGTQRDEVPPVDGGDVHLTIDADLQYTVQQMLERTVDTSGAKGGMAMVEGVKNGEVYAMSTYFKGKTPLQVGNRPVTSPFEPGSVGKVVTFGAALQRGIITPDTVYTVPGEIAMGGAVIHDAWVHSPVGMTATGILAKSSNVGTLMIAQKLGPKAFDQEMKKFGLGQSTGIQLPGESSGVVPPMSQWSATTFANLPFGQGYSLTLVQASAMYQGIANGGVRIPPTIVASTTRDGTTTAVTAGKPVRELPAKTAHTLLDMLRGTVQGGNMMYDGTAPSAKVAGYQVAGKTGTAQRVDPACGCYSKTAVNASFAGIIPADNPAFVITVMLDSPGGGAEGGAAAAPLFHDIGTYLMRQFDVPPSAHPAPRYELYTNLGG